MGICHCMVGLSFQLEMPTLTLASMCAFIFFYANSSGCITWLYCSEVSVDVALGFIGTAGYSVTFLLSLVTQPLMISPLQQDGTFYMFGGISLVASVWCYFYLRETSTCKTDKEKKELYWPKECLETDKVVVEAAVPFVDDELPLPNFGEEED